MKDKNKIKIHYKYEKKNEIKKNLRNKFNNKFLKFLIFVIFIYLIKFSNVYIKHFNHIHIAMSLNNNYTYPIMVSIASILINTKNTTFINFHIMIGNDIEKKNIIKIISLKRLYANSKFLFHNIKNTFKGWKHGKKKLTVASFYRSYLGEIIKDVKKIIYLDGDTLVYDDLTEMYELNMDNLYFRGIREIINKRVESKINRTKFICAGVMLMNLELIRKDKVFKSFRNYYISYYKRGKFYGDQHIINALFINKIGFLPPKFGIWFLDERTINGYKTLKPLIYNEKELREANHTPVIRHLWGKGIPQKPWLLKGYFKVKVEWNYYAKKTGYYKFICQFFKNACINLIFNKPKT